MTEAAQLDKVIARVEKLLSRQHALEEENVRLREANTRLTGELQEQSKVLTDTRKQLEVLKMASGLDGQDDKAALRARVNMYIKEIDKCILFLSK